MRLRDELWRIWRDEPDFSQRSRGRLPYQPDVSGDPRSVLVAMSFPIPDCRTGWMATLEGRGLPMNASAAFVERGRMPAGQQGIRSSAMVDLGGAAWGGVLGLQIPLRRGGRANGSHSNRFI